MSLSVLWKRVIFVTLKDLKFLKPKAKPSLDNIHFWLTYNAMQMNSQHQRMSAVKLIEKEWDPIICGWGCVGGL